MKPLNALMLLVLAGATSIGATPQPPPIQPWGFPAPSVVPDKMPAPQPGAVLNLVDGRQLVVQYKVDTGLQARTPGLVTLTKDAGPVSVIAKFADGTGLSEKRRFDGPCVWIVEAAGPPEKVRGRVVIDAFPLDGSLKSMDQVVATAIDVNGGQGPQPPPPGPDVVPDVKPVVVTSFRVVYVYDPKATLTKEQTGVLYSQAVATWLNANCTKDGVTPGWRRYGRDVDVTGEFPDWVALWGTVKPKLTVVPCIAVEVNGKADILNFPATEADMLTTLKTYKGVK